MKKCILIMLTALCFTSVILNGQGKHELKVVGTGFELNGRPFEYTGISFFNALFNKEFNQSSDKRKEYIRIYSDYGINVLRIWGQWDNTRRFIDSDKESTLYKPDGSLKPEFLQRLKDLLKDADEQGTVILLVMFARENINEGFRLSDEATEKAVKTLTTELVDYRNLAFQIWNEFDYQTIRYLKLIKEIDPERLVTNSPGWAGELGCIAENRNLDFLSPHTSRDDSKHWEIGYKEIEYLIRKYAKPVVDDEPARIGTPKFGGPETPTAYTDHIINIYNVWTVGGYVVYHHDMFQTGYGTPTVPPSGIPLPGFSHYHDKIFEFIKNKNRYLKNIRNK